MNHKLLVNTAVTAGEIMLKSGAEVYRVEDTICRILRISGYAKAEAFVTATGIVASLDDDSIDVITMVKRVDHRVTNLNHIYLVNDISRKLCSGEINIEEAYVQLNEIKKLKQYKDSTVWLFTIIAVMFFSLLLGGAFLECAVTCINGIFLSTILLSFRKLNINPFITNMAASFVIAVSTVLCTKLIPFEVNQEIIISSSIMVMVPGVAITNAIRDTLQGDYMAGTAGALEAFVTAATIAVGVGAGLTFCKFIQGGIF